MPIDPVKIPQNVYIEDRIVGPFTLRQIIIMAVGGGFSYLLYSKLTQTYGNIGIFATVLVWIPAAIGFMFAVVRINDLSLFRICLLLLESANTPQTRMWKPRHGLTIQFHTATKEEPKTDPKKEKEAEMALRTQARIQELSRMLDETLVAPAAPVAEAPAMEQAPAVVQAAPAAPAKPVVPEVAVEAPTVPVTQKTVADVPAPAPVEAVAEEAPELPRFLVNPNKIKVDGQPLQQDDGLSAYRGVFRDISPNS